MGGKKKMLKKCLKKKGLALVTIVIFIGISAIPATGDIETEKYAEHISLNSYGALNNDENCKPNFDGQMGENYWFVDDVWIWFSYDPVRVVEIWYRITNEEWKNYTWHPFTFGQEGDFVFEYKWKEDPLGEIHFPPVPESLRIDKTPPTINLEKKIQGIRKKIVFTAQVNDETSEINRVEFYLDDEPIATITESPYTYTYNYKDDPRRHEIKAIVYDNAGHSNSGDSDTTSVSFQYHATILSRILQRMQSISQLFLQLLKIMVRFPFNL